MEVSPASAKRTRAKSKTAAVKESPAASNKKPRSRRASIPAAPLDVVAVQPVDLSAVDLTAVIATTAYFIAAERGFAPGRELDDWLEAERRVRGIHAS